MTSKSGSEERQNSRLLHALNDLGNPLDFIAMDIQRQGDLCKIMDQLAHAASPCARDIEYLYSFLNEEFDTYIADEEQDLFPLIRRRCKPQDEIEATLDQLKTEQQRAKGYAQMVAAAVKRKVLATAPFTMQERSNLTDFAAQIRQFLNVENAIILPMARRRLTADDLRTLCLRMLQRRGLDRLIGDAI